MINLDDIKAILGPQGLFSQKLPLFEWRPSQLEMALKIAEAINKNEFLIVEAGTGVGKTFAYLIPALLSGKKVVISTGTKSLQDQLYFKDIPLLEKIFEQRLPVVYLKGRRNYLCLLRWQRQKKNKLVLTAEEKAIEKWLEHTETGDIAESPISPEWSGWNELTANTEQCLGPKCPLWDKCFLTKMKLKAQKAMLVIVNHYLFMADLYIKTQGHGWVIPPYEIVCFDEAHQLEDVVSHYFGIEVSDFRLKELVGDLKSELTNTNFKSQLNEILEASNELFKPLRHLPASRMALKEVTEYAILKLKMPSLIERLQQLSRLINTSPLDEELKEHFMGRVANIVNDLNFIISMSDEHYVYWAERRKRSVALGCSPLRSDLILKDMLYPKVKCVIFTSATLDAGDNFTFFKSRLGLPSETQALSLGSPFDYKKQALLYLPPEMPEPNNPQFIPKAVKEILQILKISQGRALLLFTSIAVMQSVYEQIKSQIPYKVLIQGEHPPARLLKTFKEDIHSVLLASASFWEGIDVPGEALSCVIIDRLPFAVPEDPLVKARAEMLERQGKSAFWHYQLPQAILTLKQGIGRLIRHRQDKGILVILDPRLKTKAYGQRFLKNLPLCQITQDLNDVAAFFKN